MTETKEVIVVGGGIAGLAAALGIGKLGKQVTVVEQAPEYGEVGAGLQLGPNGLRALDVLGVLEDVYKESVFPRRHVFMDAISGERLTELDFGDNFRRRYGYPYIVIHRTDLHGVLLKACRSLDNISLLNNHRLSTIEEYDDYVELTFENGNKLQAETVVGADGIHSKTRKLFSNDDPVASKYVAYRFTVPMSEMKIDIDWDEKYTWIGPGIHLVQYPVRHKSVINQVAVFKSYKYREDSDDWGTPDELNKMFENSCSIIKESLKFADRSLVTKMYDRDPIDKWSSKRVTLLGDAAHAMLQHLAQGACQGLEDAVYLTERLHANDSDISKALFEYQQERAPRSGKVQRGARLWGKIKHAEDPATILLRDTIFKSRKPDDYQYVDWLYHDDMDSVNKTALLG